MAYRTASLTETVIRHSVAHEPAPSLADALRNALHAHRPHLLEFLRLDETPPPRAMTLAEWTRPAELRALLACYSDHLYRHKPGQPRENKPLLSLWAQWYIGLQVPPLMLALLTQRQAIDLSPERVRVEFHETGRAACFWMAVHQDKTAILEPPVSRMEKLITRTLMPVVCALEATGDINGKLIWSNTGYLINGYLGEMRSLLGDELVATLRQRLFFSPQLSDGQHNPLWRTVVMRDGLLVRRTCCQRYRLPDVQQCGDCTLK
ncbi:siderophore-iron reductase FhuF [[Enterobacter] lignolyticus]|uniref:Ferric iron reductase involved in ferric hydroximate transport n=2 Tax=[Enterobacter] lignolyticus TaxID=1334193 RepID=E3GAU2_ENTLS|nr:siderophore-iron reductase FhuF [[Enterobacter] lignolyticus]ADO50003.1 ferric iron reductase involved in ferric hydroximate transport [[Enterobacter] lignolyticus SCF1]ALR78845.1 iron reductase [[Enterobacter] lignolyticus]